jgi:hypothetical protein
MRLALALTALWAIYNAGLVALAIRAVLSRSHRRNAYRFDVRLPVDVQVIGESKKWQNTATGDINPDGLSFFADEALALGQQVNVRLRFGRASIIRGTAVVMNNRQTPEGPYRIGARFVEMSDGDRNALTLRLFSGPASTPRVRAALKAA